VSVEASRPCTVALSSSYGAGGSVVGPRVAELLGVPFLDRAIPAAVARKLEVSFEAARAAESPKTGLGRFIASFARLSAPIGAAGPPPTGDELEDADLYRQQTEGVIWEAAMTTGGVILGRAGAVILREVPGVLRARLDGPVESRIAQVVRLKGISSSEARREQRATDRARDAYARRLYGVDPSDLRAFHLVLDGTALPFEVCADLIAQAARVLSRSPRDLG
jgi:cytidylate kinase